MGGAPGGIRVAKVIHCVERSTRACAPRCRKVVSSKGLSLFLWIFTGNVLWIFSGIFQWNFTFVISGDPKISAHPSLPAARGDGGHDCLFVCYIVYYVYCLSCYYCFHCLGWRTRLSSNLETCSCARDAMTPRTYVELYHYHPRLNVHAPSERCT